MLVALSRFIVDGHNDVVWDMLNNSTRCECGAKLYPDYDISHVSIRLALTKHQLKIDSGMYRLNDVIQPLQSNSDRKCFKVVGKGHSKLFFWDPNGGSSWTVSVTEVDFPEVELI